MAKIRGIKPDTWTDEKFVSVPPLARLLFIGMWNFCCDNGHIEDSPLQLKMRILPADNCDVRELLSVLIEMGLVVRMPGYLKVPNLPGHQKPDKRFLTFCEHCEHDENLTYTTTKPKGRTTSTPRAHVENPASARRVHADDGDGDGDGDGDNPPRPTSADAQAELAEAEPEIVEAELLPATIQPDPFDEWWTAYDKKVSRRKAHQKWKLAIKKPGITPELLIESAHRYVQHQKAIGKHPQFTKNPETWLNNECWNDELIPLATNGRPMTGASMTEADWERMAASVTTAQESA